MLAALAAVSKGPWPGLGAAARARFLTGIADTIDSRAGDIAAAEALGTGLPVAQTPGLAAAASREFRRAADLAVKRDDGGGSLAPRERSYLVQRPAGVVGVITPWRTPFLAQARAVAPALAAGCTIVLKPDEWAPLPAKLLAEITAEVGLPDGVLNIVHGSSHPRAPGSQARDALLEHPAVPVVSFSGDPVPGRELMRDAAARGKNLLAELAGSAPCLIFADADLDQATDSALFGACWLNGQRRTASSRILVERPVYDDLVSRLVARARRIRAGLPADPLTELGPMVHAAHYERVTSWVRLGIREGARLAAGGQPPPDLRDGNYLAATVLADVTPSMRVFGEQVCGPVLCVTPFDTSDEAIALANATKDALAVYIWTADLQRAHRLAPAIESADVWVNAHNALDLVRTQGGAPPGGSAAADGPASIGSIGRYTRPQAVHIAADAASAPQLGALHCPAASRGGRAW